MSGTSSARPRAAGQSSAAPPTWTRSKRPDQGFSGLSIRLLDQATGDWSIYWVNSRDGVLGLPPVTGRFENGVGLFYTDEVLEGRSIRTRFTWSDITPDSARWEQAFSPDGGATWEANWIRRASSGPRRVAVDSRRS